MRKLIFSSFDFAPTFVASVYNMVQQSIDEGHEVHLVNCQRSFSICGFNTYGLRYMCDICVYRGNLVKQEVQGHYNSYRLDELFDASDIGEAKKFVSENKPVSSQTVYEGFDVGESVLSSYISKTRDRDVELVENQDMVDNLAQRSVIVFRALLRFMQKHKIDEVILFNGRWDYYRAVFRAANQYGIPCLVFENLRSGSYVEFFQNAFPHIIKLRQDNVDAAWDEQKDSSLRQQVAHDFFSRKRGGQAVNTKSYVANQKKALLPDGIDRSKKLLVLFNNSDDEVAAIGGDEYVNPYFSSQIDGVEYLADLVGQRLHDHFLVIRVHPNLDGLQDFSYVSRLYKLIGKYPNVLLIRPESPVDSYALLDIADRVITFGSSIGVEANYWRKPVVLLAKTFYSLANIAHEPASKADIERVLTVDLPLKPIEGSDRIAYYLMRGGVKSKYVTVDPATKAIYFRKRRVDGMPLIRKNYYRALKLMRIRNANDKA